MPRQPRIIQLAGTDVDEKSRKTLFSILRSIDTSYKINPRELYLARDANGYEVEMLAEPSFYLLPNKEAFAPMQTLLE